MNHRIPLAVAVVGALLVGGATTGTTLALWRDQVIMGGSQVRAGELTITVKDDGETSADLPSITDLTPGGAPVTVIGRIRNTSPAGAKNLRIDVSLSQVAVASSPAPTSGFTLANLLVDVRARSGATCPTLTASELTSAVGYTKTALNTAALNANETVPICVSVAAASTMPNGAGGHLSMTFQGVQVP